MQEIKRFLSPPVPAGVHLYIYRSYNGQLKTSFEVTTLSMAYLQRVRYLVLDG